MCLKQSVNFLVLAQKQGCGAVRRWRLDYDWDKSLTVLHQHTSETYTDLGPYHPAALDAFIEAVKTGNRSLIRSDYSDGAKTLALTLAANRSLETGEVVLL